MPRLSKIGAAALAAFGWTSGASVVSASYLQVAGGGAGGDGNSGVAGTGGGAGGYLTGTVSLNTTSSYTVIVGAGGSGTSTVGNNGNNSQFSSLTASVGGGGGGSYPSSTGVSGGSGGGGAYNSASGGSGTSGQGNSGGAGTSSSSSGGGGGGGGGAGASGSSGSGTTGGNGGVGLASSISGTSTYYAGGGGGAGVTNGTGGNGGGANGNWNTYGISGTANTGGGGGGGGNGALGGNGGSGIVIISYLAPQKFGGGVVTASGSNIIHTFTTSGTLTPLTSLSASYLVVAGGGGGAWGGGGAGGLLSGSSLTIDSNSTYLVTVGAGGSAGFSTVSTGTQGGSSAFSMVTTTAVGGGTGNINGGVGGNGGSGGGASNTGGSGGTATSGQGNVGGSATGTQGAGAGGGGSGSAGSSPSAVAGQLSNGGAGGSGTTSTISGVSVGYAGGGGGGGRTLGTGGSAINGGGAGGAGSNPPVAGTSGTIYTGGGGGGGGYYDPVPTSGSSGGAGGSGVVIISYPGSTQQMAGGTVTIIGGNVIHTFTSSGYLTPIKYVNNSLRFRSSASAYLNRTPSVAGNQKTWTYSFWIKLGTIGAEKVVLGTSVSNTPFTKIYFDTNSNFTWYEYTGSNYVVTTTQVFRDPSSWYHVVLSVDTTQATASNRAKLYINGVQVTSFSSSSYVPQNTNTTVNSAVATYIGQPGNGGSYLDGYMTEVNFIDGQALTPNSFGTFNSYGVWQPISYGGSYGTNGFYLPFTNKTSTTTLGYDFSPNGNNWTTNNISLTAGSTYDSMTDVPTLTSATASNYAVLNPLVYRFSTGQNGYSNANLTLTGQAGGNTWFNMGTIGIPASSGKFYFECQIGTASNGIYVGVTQDSNFQSANWDAYYDSANGVLYKGASTFATGLATATTGDVIAVAYDSIGNTCAFYKNNTLLGTVTGLTSATMFPLQCARQSAVLNLNYGQQPWTYTPPTGFVALNTYNL